MRRFLTLWAREMAGCFLSPIAYVIMVLFFAASSFTFFFGVLRNAGEVQSLVLLVVSAIVLWQPVLITVVCMRLFAEEKRTGTIEPLMTAPVTEAEIVMGKYAGALSFVLLVSLPVMGCVYALAALSPGVEFIDNGAVLGGALILSMLSAFFVAVGLFVSLLTRNQIVAAIGCFSAAWLVVLFGHLLAQIPLPWVYNSAELYSVVSHVEAFVRGSIDTRTLVQYVAGTWFILFVSVRMLESKRWL